MPRHILRIDRALRVSPLPAALWSALAIACSDSDTSSDRADAGSGSREQAAQKKPTEEAQPETARAKSDKNDKAPEPLKLQIEVRDVKPGEESTQCVQLRLPNTDAVSITKIHNTISSGSHHFIVSALSDEKAEESELAPCRGFAGALAGAPLTITQKHDDLVTLPEGIGYRLHAHQVMNLELHYINTTAEPLDIVAQTQLYPADPGADVKDGSVILMGTSKLNIPPHETYKIDPKFLKLPQGMEDVKFYAITGHTHRFGTKVSVHTADADKAEVDALYDPERFDWEAPEMKQLEPHARVPADGGFLLQCEWDNTTDNVIKWGESATAEMCFFWGYYYPKKDVISLVIDDIDQQMLKASAAKPPQPKSMP